MAYFFVKKHSFSFHPFTHPLSPKLCEGTPPISYASLWNQERLKIRGLGSPPNPVIQQNNAFQRQAWVSDAWVSPPCQLFLMDGFPQKRRTLPICLWPPLLSQPPFLWTRVVMRQHGRWGLISTNRVTGINCFMGVTVGTRTEGLLTACVLWCQWCPWFLFIPATIQCQAVIMILITLWHPGDVRHMHATELRPRFKYVSARLRPDLRPAMGHTPLISSLCQLLLKPICHKERDKMKRRERRAEGERVSMQNGGGVRGAV